MQVILHTGAHYTDEDRLMKCLLRNKGDFADRGIAVPGPGKFRKLLKDTFNALKHAPASPEARDILLDTILDEEKADRLILSNTHFFGAPRTAVRNGVIYPLAPERIANMCDLFPNDQVEMFMAIRNPASFLPAVFEHSPQDQFADFLGGVDPREMRWSDTLMRIHEAAPNVPITVWCNEDTPLIWAQIIRDLAGLQSDEKIIGGFDLLGEIMTSEGMKRFRAYLKSHDVMTETQKRRVISAFLDKFAIEEKLEEELDLPGWTDELVEEMTEIYDRDVDHIQHMPGVKMISP